jgi:protein SCO1/2
MLAPLSAQGIGGGLEVFDAAASFRESLGAQAPLDVRLVDEDRKPVTLRDYCDGRRPVILNLGYYGCPALCGEVLNGFLEALRGVRLQPGTDFRIVTASIHPGEQPPLAREKKNSVLQAWPVSGVSDAWAFLTGEQDQVKKLCEAVGFGYRWNDSSKQFDHPAGLILLSPDGKVTRYLYGMSFSPRDLRLALVEASAGKIGKTWDRILLSCYQYDPAKRTYSLALMTVVRIGGVLTVLAIAAMIFFLWRRERLRTLVAAA